MRQFLFSQVHRHLVMYRSWRLLFVFEHASEDDVRSHRVDRKSFLLWMHVFPHASHARLNCVRVRCWVVCAGKIPENKKAIAVAREHGDLKENSEYKMARQDQTTLMARKGQLERDLAVAQITDFTEAPTEVVGIGSTVEIENGDSGEKVTYHILGAWDSDPDHNILSYKTPLAQNLLGKEAAAVVEVDVAGNAQTWKLNSIARYVDSK